MTLRRLLVVAALFSLAAAPQPSGWRSIWNGKSLDGWTTWMQAPSPTSEVPGLKRDETGKYLEPIGSGRDPLKVFSVAEDVDGRSAIRISGEAFGELRTKESFKDYHLKFQFTWGEKKWPPRDRPDTRRDGCITYGIFKDARARSVELQIQEATWAISTRSDRRSPSAQSSARRDARDLRLRSCRRVVYFSRATARRDAA